MQRKYNISSLLEENKIWEKSDFIFFWKTFDNKINKQIFSQWNISSFIVDNQEYNCAEQYMMAEKARIFKDEAIRDKILKTTNPAKIKALGREIHNFKDDVWKKNRFDVVVKGNLAKFSQNENYKDFLLSTGDKILAEASPFDKIWGIGLDENNPYAINPEDWKGQNLLGFALMEVRDILRK